MKDSVVKRGYRFASIYTRRLLALLMFGLIHGWFIWYGDILLHYALLGFFLLLFHKRKAKTLLVWACILLLLVPGLMLLSGTDGSYEPNSELMDQVHQWVAGDEAVYDSGSWAEIQELRINDWNSSLVNQIIFYPQILGLFLLAPILQRKMVLESIRKLFDTIKDLSMDRRTWFPVPSCPCSVEASRD